MATVLRADGCGTPDLTPGPGCPATERFSVLSVGDSSVLVRWRMRPWYRFPSAGAAGRDTAIGIAITTGSLMDGAIIAVAAAQLRHRAARLGSRERVVWFP